MKEPIRTTRRGSPLERGSTSTGDGVGEREGEERWIIYSTFYVEIKEGRKEYVGIVFCTERTQ